LAAPASKSLASPLVLNPGSYSIVSYGFDN
jgi:hypothetical protein